ncbi:MAG: hypothetical protein GY862_09090 [Gammaproteobacteria bacterium]|nr:hypothetical protein [Gammaproteobacteria bacterium]
MAAEQRDRAQPHTGMQQRLCQLQEMHHGKCVTMPVPPVVLVAVVESDGGEQSFLQNLTAS